MLGENRRQRDTRERAALAQWRDGQREQALRTRSQAGRVIAGRAVDDTMAQMLADWGKARARYRGQVHAELAGLALAARQGGPARPTPGRERERERQQAYRPPPGRGVDRGPGLSR